ncbi:MAG: hypothetical protein KC502_12990 [Myxococcales bacterium]|nr:hypothetical protein [Myxococcales bacterium]
MMSRRRFMELTGMALGSVSLIGLLPDAWAAKPTRVRKEPVKPGMKPKRPTVAVLYFDYAGKDDELAVLRKGLAQMLISDLASNPHIRLVERARLEAILAELKLSKSRKVDAKTAARIGKLLGAQYLVLGSYFSLMGSLRIDARLVAVETGRIVHSTGANGKLDEFLTIQTKVGSAMATAIAAGLPPVSLQKSKSRSKTSRRRPRRRRPKRLRTRTAVRFAKALDAKDRGDKAAATAHLKAVVKEQPAFGLARQELAMLVQ